MGRQPYAGVDNFEMTKYLRDGHRLEKPTLCSDEMLVIYINKYYHNPVMSIAYRLLSVQKITEKLLFMSVPVHVMAAILVVIIV